MHVIHYPKSLNIAVFLWTQRNETDDIRGNDDAGLFGSKLVLWGQHEQNQLKEKKYTASIGSVLNDY